MESVSTGIMGLVDALERGTDFIGVHMKKLILIALIIAGIYWWTHRTETVPNDQTGVVATPVPDNSKSWPQSISDWLVEHTPKK